MESIRRQYLEEQRVLSIEYRRVHFHRWKIELLLPKFEQEHLHPIKSSKTRIERGERELPVEKQESVELKKWTCRSKR